MPNGFKRHSRHYSPTLFSPRQSRRFPKTTLYHFRDRFSPEARDIIDRQNLSVLHILDFPNPDYEKEKREQARLKESHKLEDKIAASWEPPKNIEITIKYFCHPNGITRSFPSAGEPRR